MEGLERHIRSMASVVVVGLLTWIATTVQSNSMNSVAMNERLGTALQKLEKVEVRMLQVMDAVEMRLTALELQLAVMQEQRKLERDQREFRSEREREQ